MLKHGILGLLNYGDMSGYEIRDAFQNSLNYFWSAQTSQIYRELDTLEKKRWIEKHTVEQSGRPNKNVCSLTDAGREELLRWLSQDDIDMEMRSSVLMKTFFAGELPPEEGVAFLDSVRQSYASAQRALEQAERSMGGYQAIVPDARKALFWKMTLDFGRRYMQLCQDWSEDCIRLLREGEEEA